MQFHPNKMMQLAVRELTNAPLCQVRKGVNHRSHTPIITMALKRRRAESAEREEKWRQPRALVGGRKAERRLKCSAGGIESERVTQLFWCVDPIRLAAALSPAQFHLGNTLAFASARTFCISPLSLLALALTFATFQVSREVGGRAGDTFPPSHFYFGLFIFNPTPCYLVRNFKQIKHSFCEDFQQTLS